MAGGQVMQLDAVDLGDARGDRVVRSSRIGLAGKSRGEKQQAEHCQTQSALHKWNLLNA